MVGLILGLLVDRNVEIAVAVRGDGRGLRGCPEAPPARHLQIRESERVQRRVAGFKRAVEHTAGGEPSLCSRTRQHQGAIAFQDASFDGVVGQHTGAFIGRRQACHDAPAGPKRRIQRPIFPDPAAKARHSPPCGGEAVPATSMSPAAVNISAVGLPFCCAPRRLNGNETCPPLPKLGSRPPAAARAFAGDAHTTAPANVPAMTATSALQPSLASKDPNDRKDMSGRYPRKPCSTPRLASSKPWSTASAGRSPCPSPAEAVGQRRAPARCCAGRRMRLLVSPHMCGLRTATCGRPSRPTCGPAAGPHMCGPGTRPHAAWSTDGACGRPSGRHMWRPAPTDASCCRTVAGPPAWQTGKQQTGKQGRWTAT